jgi:hypothetical protein
MKNTTTTFTSAQRDLLLTLQPALEVIQGRSGSLAVNIRRLTRGAVSPSAAAGLATPAMAPQATLINKALIMTTAASIYNTSKSKSWSRISWLR